jgi:glycosyltransferase involved in cell wall biosynthesis
MLKVIRATTVPQTLNTLCKGVIKDMTEKYEVIALSSPGQALEDLKKDTGIRTIAVAMERHISIFKDLRSLWQIYRVMRREKPTMVHSMTPKAGLLCMIASKLTHVPVRIHTFTGLVFPTSHGIKRRILMTTDSITCRCATHIIPEGEGVKHDLLVNGITKKPLKVLGYGNIRGVDMDYFDRRPEVMQAAASLKEADAFTFLFVGRIARDKGINELCEAFEKLTKKYPSARLLLVGPNENDLDPISASSSEIIKNNNRIELVGRKSGLDFLAYYAVADCFVFPSYREGFPNTVLEAGAFGLPSIVTDINGSREIIVEGENGVIIPPRDGDALYNAMLRMIEDNEHRTKLASNARRMVAERFEQGFVRKCLFDYYEEVLSSYK